MRESFELMVGKRDSPSIQVDESDIMAENSNPEIISAEASPQENEIDFDPVTG